MFFDMIRKRDFLIKETLVCIKNRLLFTNKYNKTRHFHVSIEYWFKLEH